MSKLQSSDVPGDPWAARDSANLYRVQAWGEGYFGIDEDGSALAWPRQNGKGVNLREVADALEQEGLRLPVLLRFTDVLGDRVKRLCAGFDQACSESGYRGKYTAVYPVKVNQQRTVVEHLLRFGDQRIGLEAGSKPELMAVLGLTPPGRTIVCNGYKDSTFIRLALAGQQFGHRVFLVVEKPSEIADILAISKELGLRPCMGLRVRLSSVAAGHWQNTGGDKAKFGLTAGQVVDVVEQLRAADALDCLQMLHVHIGSQVADRAALARAMAETASVYRALRKLGSSLDCVDVGGGLAVDYEGRRATSFCSMNYALEDYAKIVVETLQKTCEAHDLPHPEIISESGRAMTAHHAVLLTEVIDHERVEGETSPSESTQIADPVATYEATLKEIQAVQAAFTQGEIDLPERAKTERAAYERLRQLEYALSEDDPTQRPSLIALRERLAEKYFCNFSVFQSVPDVWALDQIFPVMPIERLHERPDRRVRLCDLTCDSDGRMDRYVDEAGLDSSLPLHALKDGERYRLGIFLVGAYQENLGDMHNMFGDTDVVNVELDDSPRGWYFSEAELGDRADELLRYVHFEPDDLRAAYRAKLDAAQLEPEAYAQCLRLLDEGLSGYTYLLD